MHVDEMNALIDKVTKKHEHYDNAEGDDKIQTLAELLPLYRDVIKTLEEFTDENYNDDNLVLIAQLKYKLATLLFNNLNLLDDPLVGVLEVKTLFDDLIPLLEGVNRSDLLTGVYDEKIIVYKEVIALIREKIPELEKGENEDLLITALDEMSVAQIQLIKSDSANAKEYFDNAVSIVDKLIIIAEKKDNVGLIAYLLKNRAVAYAHYAEATEENKIEHYVSSLVALDKAAECIEKTGDRQLYITYNILENKVYVTTQLMNLDAEKELNYLISNIETLFLTVDVAFEIEDLGLLNDVYNALYGEITTYALKQPGEAFSKQILLDTSLKDAITFAKEKDHTQAVEEFTKKRDDLKNLIEKGKKIGLDDQEE